METLFLSVCPTWLRSRHQPVSRFGHSRLESRVEEKVWRGVPAATASRVVSVSGAYPQQSKPLLSVKARELAEDGATRRDNWGS